MKIAFKANDVSEEQLKEWKEIHSCDWIATTNPESLLLNQEVSAYIDPMTSAPFYGPNSKFVINALLERNNEAYVQNWRTEVPLVGVNTYGLTMLRNNTNQRIQLAKWNDPITQNCSNVERRLKKDLQITHAFCFLDRANRYNLSYCLPSEDDPTIYNLSQSTFIGLVENVLKTH